MSLSDYKVLKKDGDFWKCKCKKDDSICMVKMSHETSEQCEKMKGMKQQLQHRNIIQLKDAFSDDNKFYFVMEWCDNGDFENIIECRKLERLPFNEEEILDLLIDICFALQHLHARQLVRREFTPADIFLTSTCVAKISFFGVDSFPRADAALNQPTTDVDLSLCETYKRAEVRSLGECARKMMRLISENNNNAVDEVEDRVSTELNALVNQLMGVDPGRGPVITVIEILKTRIIRTRVLAKLSNCIDVYCNLLNESSTMLRDVAEDLRFLHRRVLKTRIGMATVGVFFGMTAIAAGIATVVTAGMLAPVVIGVAAGSTAALTGLSGLTAQLVAKFQDSVHVKQTKAKLKASQNVAIDLLEHMESIAETPELVDTNTRASMTDTMKILRDELTVTHRSTLRENANVVGSAGIAVSASAKCAAHSANIAGRATGQLVVTAGKVSGAVGIGLGAVGVGLDIWQLVDAAMDFRKDNPSEASKRIIEVIDIINKRSELLNKLCDRLGKNDVTA